jgi:bacteriocin-like protein|tara:strand:+ start:99 stop:356 length:258 start_codon:yes stop_codon:yes gene_type:complete
MTPITPTPYKVIRRTSLFVVLHNNDLTGIDQLNPYSRRLKMTKQKKMTEKELEQVSGGPYIRNFNGSPGVIEKRNNSAVRRLGIP